LVEANTDRQVDGNDLPLDGRYNFVPNIENANFTHNKTFFFPGEIPESEADISGHATSVAARFFGDLTSLAPGVGKIDLYFADNWLKSDFLQPATNALPRVSDARVFNHSYIDPTNGATLARLDYSVDTNEVIQVVAVNNVSNGGASPGLATSFNAISAGLSSGSHEKGTANALAPLTNRYKKDARVKPDIVVPEDFTSYAAAYVSGAASMLAGFGHDNPPLSDGSIVLALPSTPEYTLQNAERPEVVRSALMAGADRLFSPDYDVVNNGSKNGLDNNLGAGQLDIFQSYHILAGGEQGSIETGASAPLLNYGFDYVDAFESDDEATYQFNTGPYTESLAASLVWNLQVDLDFAGGSFLNTDLPNFEIELLQLAENGEAVLFSSIDPIADIDNTENIWLPSLEPDSSFLLRVSRGIELDAPISAADFALSWRRSPLEVIPGDIDLDGQVGLSDFDILKRSFGIGTTPEEGDLNVDFMVDLGDFTLLKEHFGGSVSTILGQSSLSTGAAVPEPATWVLALLAALALCVTDCNKTTFAD